MTGAGGLAASPLACGSDPSGTPPSNVTTVQGPLSPLPYQDSYSGKTVTHETMAWDLVAKRQPNAPLPGEPAPDFTLTTADGRHHVRLLDLARDKPVVMILSSWGCDIFRESLAGLHSLYTTYHDHAHFVMVYLREAHPLDSGFARELGRVIDPKTSRDRAAVALRCREQLRLPFLMLVDPIEDPIATRWAAWPVRLFVVDTDGSVSYAGAQGPWGYRPYRGFLHGEGPLSQDVDRFSMESLEEFLERRFSVRRESSSPLAKP